MSLIKTKMGNGDMKSTKPRGKAVPLTIDMVKMITTMLKSNESKTDLRDLALLRVGIDTMLRVSDIVGLTVGDVSDSFGNIVTEFTARQKKTGGVVVCDISETTREVLRQYIDSLPIRDRGTRLFPICIRQVQRTIKRLMAMIRVDGKRYSPHSLRRTKASIIYDRTKNIEAVRQLLGHSSVAATSQYLNIDVNEALAVARSVEI